MVSVFAKRVMLDLKSNAKDALTFLIMIVSMIPANVNPASSGMKRISNAIMIRNIKNKRLKIINIMMKPQNLTI